MSRRAATVIALVFAALWLRIGAAALPGRWPIVVGIAGIVALALICVLAGRRSSPGEGRFDRSRYRLAVLGELAGFAFLAWLLSSYPLERYIWPAIGIVVGLHFIGLWWASGRRRFLVLSGGMTAINLVALVVPAAVMVPLSGLGSAAALAAAVGWP